MAFAFQLMNIREIYRVGGAQAIAAMALGTRSIPKVDKIAGPGSRYVATAKKLLFGLVDIDIIAGPSEICIVADRNAPSRFIAMDLLSQAEHGTGLESVMLLTDSPALAARVQAEVNKLTLHITSDSPIGQVLAKHSFIAILPSIRACLDGVNSIAPEHLELMVKNPLEALRHVRHAGAVFLGSTTCESLGDYYAGPNHVLPTGGRARFSSPVGVYDFVKRMNVLSYGTKAIRKAAEPVARMANAEGLPFHAEAALIRSGR
jgi:histidinol dehydrogenase